MDLGNDHPFYRPLWRRIVIVGVIAAWVAYEVFSTQSPLWMTLSIGTLCYAVWAFLLQFPPQKGDGA